MANSYSALNVTIRLFEQRLMTADDFKQLWQQTSDEAMRQRLADHHYPVKDDWSWEQIFDARLKADYEELYAMAPDKRVLDLFALRFDYHNLKVLFKEQIAKRDFSALYLPYGHYALTTLKGLITGEGDTVFPEIMEQTVREVSAAYQEQKDSNVISILFDLGYLKHMKALAQAIGDQSIEQWVVQWIDLKNMIMGLRMRSEQRSRGFMFVTLSDQGSITEEEWVDALMAGDQHALVALVKRVSDDLQIQKLVQSETIAIPALERAVAQHQATLMQSSQLQAFGPLPVMSYLYFLGHEIANLRLIITGKQNHLELSAIEERMQPIYES